MLHEFGLAVNSIFGGEAFFKYAGMIFSDKQTGYFDSEVYDKSRRQLHEHLVIDCIAAAVFAEERRTEVMEFLGIEPGSGNSGNKATGLMKLCTKFHRVRGVHVTPTVFVNGVESPDISSGWTIEQWEEKLGTVK